MDKNAELSIFERIYKDIKEYKKEGCIIKIFEPEDFPRVVRVEDILQQPGEGLLYDLGLDEAYMSAKYKDDPLKFADLMAISSVIEFLHKFYMENKKEPKE